MQDLSIGRGSPPVSPDAATRMAAREADITQSSNTPPAPGDGLPDPRMKAPGASLARASDTGITLPKQPGARAAAAQGRWWSDEAFAALDHDRPPKPLVTNFLEGNCAQALSTGRMLSIGFGNAAAMGAFLEAGWTEVFGVDMDTRCLPFAQKLALRHGQKVHAETNTIQAYDMPRNLDVIDATGFTLCFMSRDEARRVLQRGFEATRPGGWFIALFFQPGHDIAARGKALGLTVDELTPLLADIGYVDVTCWPDSGHDVRGDTGHIFKNWAVLPVRAMKPEASS